MDQYSISRIATFADRDGRTVTIWRKFDKVDYRFTRYACRFNNETEPPASWPLKTLYSAYLAVKALLPDAHLK